MATMMRLITLSGCTAAAFAAVSLLASPAAAVTLTEALSAYRANRVAEAERGLAEIASDPAAGAEDRAAALRELGRIDWLVRGETDAAAAALASAQTGADRCRAVLMALRVYREAGEPRVALDAALTARGECAPDEAEAMRVALARAYIEAARLSPGDAAEHLLAAADELGGLRAIAARAPTVAAAQLSLAIAQRDAAGAFAAWRNYFWLDDGDAPQAMAAYAGRVETLLTTGLATSASEAERAALVDMLIRAGFARDARALAGAMSNDAVWTRAHAYFAFYSAVQDATLRANRLMARGQGADRYEQEITTAMEVLMQAAGLTGDPREALREAYGLYGTIGETSGYPSLHGGHLVQDEALSVAQYGRSGELRFIVIDNMLANGFESWLWDGWAQAGGWATDDGAIVQVRSAYTGGPLQMLQRARPGPTRDRALADMESSAATERATLGRDGVGELPSTSERLELQAIDQIAARAGADDAAFIAEAWRATVHYSITLHEGRHALDKADRNYSSENLEFRAKLSQIALSDTPRLGLANVAGGTHADTPHGNANRRVLAGFRTWMRRHRAEIAGFDLALPTLMQLHLLTDDQIRTAAQSLDPWAS